MAADADFIVSTAGCRPVDVAARLGISLRHLQRVQAATRAGKLVPR